MLPKNRVDVATEKLKNHPSVKLISDNINLSLDDILREVVNFNSAKNDNSNISTLCLKNVWIYTALS